ncbi:hypothetical protein N7539_007193 [Penicillium diatomitis]|uniref:Uncharacterized protein n=1 Tax=Penicillium diatomitis TaxID=2819901 RepID=A0A9X0BNL9_9EURO|nr:uncharacterized protein N7539_007193 [Penicillium diatomitis]KAJ5477049.1 hypothetical protein N7539_007193 [Penicillium diatomitis]
MPPGALPGSLIHNTERSRSRQRLERGPAIPSIDLSTLEGPPFEDPRSSHSMHTPGISRLNQSAHARQSVNLHTLYNKPLPPRPASADPATPRRGLSPVRVNVNFRRRDHEAGSSQSQHSTQLGRAPVRQRQQGSGPSGPGPSGPVLREMTASGPGGSTHRTSPPSMDTHLQVVGPRGATRTHSTPLPWQEHGQLWMPQQPALVRDSSARLTRPPQLEIYTVSDSEEERSVRDYDLVSPPPPYESHDFDCDRWDQSRFGPRLR